MKTIAISLTVAMFLVGGLIVLLTIEEAEAKNAISESQNKGQQCALKERAGCGSCA